MSKWEPMDVACVGLVIIGVALGAFMIVAAVMASIGGLD